ncbi:helix-turn-helix transcriptional regulator [Pseudoxanthomonas sp. PXM02]|uniref:helix-turn-helix domain-containing protein n=1 Tax=Pseudoxanthomonas sp. PXM02 TaxID=2769294 RepID=UPI001780DD45|nr:helix-turn-helix transcriptional regulator [Pseudoxanthomonas sp. PXM02]MBD9478533.1 helix-turn-helix transcriptional regulator [Pseudoxanthomonas sp. PXM02]
MELGKRLKEERQRLGLTQQAMAEACDSSKRAQLNYESGDQVPGGMYLAAAADLGVDVVFVLTGRSSAQASASAEDAALLAHFHRMKPEVRNLILEILLQLNTSAPTSKRGITIKGGEQAQVIQGNPVQPDLTINVGGGRGARKK